MKFKKTKTAQPKDGTGCKTTTYTHYELYRTKYDGVQNDDPF
jgi:hypothetical protein